MLCPVIGYGQQLVSKRLDHGSQAVMTQNIVCRWFVSGLGGLFPKDWITGKPPQRGPRLPVKTRFFSLLVFVSGNLSTALTGRSTNIL